MFVIPVPFSKEHKSMLAHCKELLEYQNGMVAIHPIFNKLIVALRTAVESGEGYLDKEATSHTMNQGIGRAKNQGGCPLLWLLLCAYSSCCLGIRLSYCSISQYSLRTLIGQGKI